MNILLSHAYSTYNNGDAAIVSAQIAELKRTFKTPHLDILTIDAIRPGTKLDGVTMHNALMFGAVTPGHNNRIRKLLFAAGMMSYTLLWAIIFRNTSRRLFLPKKWHEPMELLVNADMQVCVGGGYLRARDDHISTILLMLLFHQIWLAKILCKPVYLYAQSFGPYPKTMQKRLAKFSLNKVDLILVREAKSYALLQGMGLDKTRIVQVPDSAFMFDSPARSDLRKQLFGATKSNGKVVGVTVRAWLDDKAQSTYEKEMAAFVDYLQSKGLKVAIIPQVTSTLQNDDDRVVGNRISQLLRRNNNVLVLDRRYSHYEIKSVFAELDYLVGTRFHSVIFALSSQVPAIAIEYEHKTSGIMRDLKLDAWVLPIEAVTADKLISLFDKLEIERDTYVEHLRKVVPEYAARARETGIMIKQAYFRSQDVGA